MKKTINILLIIVIIISITGCGKTKTSDAQRFKEEYERENGKKSKSGKDNRNVSISEDNPFVYATAEEISKKISDKETFIVYFGFSTCPWCRSVIEQLIKCAKDNGVTTIYYVDVLNIRDTKELDENGEIKTTKEGTKGYMELLEKIGNVLDEYTIESDSGEKISMNEKRIYAPNTVAVVDGVATKMEEGISDELTDPYMELTEEIKKYAYNSFKCIFKCLETEESMCTKKTC